MTVNIDGNLVGTIQYVENVTIYEFTNVDVRGSEVKIVGGKSVLQLAEVQVLAPGSLCNFFLVNFLMPHFSRDIQDCIFVRLHQY